MGDTVIDRYTCGQGRLIPVDHVGPASYTTGGETLGNTSSTSGQAAVGLGSLDLVITAGVSNSGNYYLRSKSAGTGIRKSFFLLWFAAGFTEGVNLVTGSGGSGMTVGTYALSFTNTGTGGTGAAGTITVLTATTYTISVTNPGSGYTSAPTVSAATGGTPPTLTATIGAVSGGEVASGTNLSGETVRLIYAGR